MVHGRFKGYVMESCAFAEVYEDCSTIWTVSEVSNCTMGRGDLPISTDKRSWPSGDNAIQAMFFRFSNERVRDLLLFCVSDLPDEKANLPMVTDPMSCTCEGN